MAMKIETRELQPILAETQSAEGYALGLNGILKGYANEMKISYLNTTGSATVKIESGILLWQGKRIYADNTGISFEIPNETTSNTTYNIYLKIDMGQPDNVVALYSKTGTYPGGYVTDDLFNNFRDGVNFVKIGEFTNTAIGVLSVKKTINYVSLPANEVVLWSGSAIKNDELLLSADPKDFAFLAAEMNFGARLSCILSIAGNNNQAVGSTYTANDTVLITNFIDIARVDGLTWKVNWATYMPHTASSNHGGRTDRPLVRLIGFGKRGL